MRVLGIHIQNYRSIKELKFKPSPYQVLIGENNAGKSNILKALKLVIGEKWPSERDFTEDDFYLRDTSEPIIIRVYFDEDMEVWHNNLPVKVAGFQLLCKAYKRAVKDKPAGTLSTDYTCLLRDGNEAKVPVSPIKTGEQYKGRWIACPVKKETRDAVSLIYIDVLRDYSKQDPSSRWSVLRRLFDTVNKEFIKDKDIITILNEDGKPQKVTRKEAFELTINRAHEYLKTDSFRKIETTLANNAIEQMGLDDGEDKVSLNFNSHDPINAYKSLQLYVNQLGITSPADEVGAGLQSAIVIAIFRTYQEIQRQGAIFAIEEPEVFLHPQKARYFSSILQSLAQKCNQIFITTHSPVFVQIDDPESLAIVRRPKNEGTVIKQAKKIEIAENDRKAVRLLTEFDAQRNEMFFARRLVFVEGNTDKLVLTFVFQKLGFNINKMNISIVECGGKTLIPFFAKVADAFEIPFVVIADHDIREIMDDWSEKRKISESERNTMHKQWNDRILEVTGKERLFFLYPNLESELGLPADDSTKIDKALELFSTIEVDRIPVCLKNPVNKLLKDIIKETRAEELIKTI